MLFGGRTWTGALEVSDKATTEAQAVWQRAQEIAYQWPLLNAPAQSRPPAACATAAVQAAFCIDVRYEVFRRALESVAPNIQTLGFADFFGLPISYTPIGTEATRPQLPGLLAHSLTVTDSCGQPDEDLKIASQRRVRLHRTASWQPFQRLPGSAFTLVESLGLGYLGKLIRRSLPIGTDGPMTDLFALTPVQTQQLRPQLVMPDAQVSGERVALARGILGAMSLTEGFARLVLLVGYGSQSANNPHAAGLDCGACCGQTDEVNARALGEESILIPDTTYFLTALHNTTTDEVVIFDRKIVPASHEGDLEQLETLLSAAGQRAGRTCTCLGTRPPGRKAQSAGDCDQDTCSRLGTDAPGLGLGKQCRFHCCAALAFSRNRFEGALFPASLRSSARCRWQYAGTHHDCPHDRHALVQHAVPCIHRRQHALRQRQQSAPQRSRRAYRCVQGEHR